MREAYKVATGDEATPDEVTAINEIYGKAGTPVFLRTRDQEGYSAELSALLAI